MFRHFFLSMRHNPLLFVFMLCSVTSFANDEKPADTVTEFQKQWNDFLKRKYKIDEELDHAWQLNNEPMGDEMLYGNFESQKWFVHTDDEAVWRKREENGVFRFELKKKGKASWIPIFSSAGHAFEAGKTYTFSIKAKADKPADLWVDVRRSSGNYKNIGFSDRMALTTEWKTFTFTFVPKETSHNTRLGIGSFKAGFTYDFRDATLKPGGRTGLSATQTLREGTIPLIDSVGHTKPINAVEKPAVFPQKARDDFSEFLLDIEKQ